MSLPWKKLESFTYSFLSIFFCSKRHKVRFHIKKFTKKNSNWGKLFPYFGYPNLWKWFSWNSLHWIQVGETIAFSKNAILDKRLRIPHFFLSPLLTVTVEVCFVLMVLRKPFMEINVQYLEHLSSALCIGHHLRTRKKKCLISFTLYEN